MENYNLAKIAEMMKQSARRMGVKEPDAGQCVGVFNHCAKHGIETIREALVRLESTEEYFPKTAKIVSAVKNIVEKDKYKQHATYDERCRYNDHSESKISREQCHKKLDKDEAMLFVAELGKPICAWHRDVIHAKKYPNSAKANVVNSHIDFFSKMKVLGSEVEQKGRRDLEEYVNAT